MTPQSKNIEPYLATGFESIKLGSNSKAPIQKNWTKCKSLSTNQAISWMEKGNNIGVRMRPIDLIIDVDPRNFEAGINSLDKLIDDFGLVSTSTVKTGGEPSGYHLYFSKPENVRIKKSLRMYPGIEFFSVGHQVVSSDLVQQMGMSRLNQYLDSTRSARPPNGRFCRPAGLPEPPQRHAPRTRFITAK